MTKTINTVKSPLGERMNKEDNKKKDFSSEIELVAIILAAVLAEVLMPYITTNIFTTGLSLVLLFGSFLYFVKRKSNTSNLNLIRLLTAMIHAVSYIIIRCVVSAIKPSLSADFTGISSEEVARFSSWFSIGYAVFQIPAGMLVRKYGQRFYALMASLGSLSIILSSFVKPGITKIFGAEVNNYLFLCILRLLAGSFFSVAILGVVNVISKISTRWFSLILNLSQFISFSIGAEVTESATKSVEDVKKLIVPEDEAIISQNLSKSFFSFSDWKSSSFAIGVIGLVGSISHLILGEDSSEESRKSNAGETSNSSNFTLKDFFSNKFLIAVTLFCIGSVFNYYVLLQGYFKTVVSQVSVSNTSIVEKIINKSTGYGMLLLPLLLQFMTPEKIIVFLGGINLIGIIMLCFASQYGIYSIGFASLLVTGGCLASMVPPSIINRDYTKDSTFIYSVINFFCMSIGAAGSEWLSGIIIGKSVQNVVPADVLFMLKVLCIPTSLIATLIGIYIYFSKNKNNNNNNKS